MQVIYMPSTITYARQKQTLSSLLCMLVLSFEALEIVKMTNATQEISNFQSQLLCSQVDQVIIHPRKYALLSD